MAGAVPADSIVRCPRCWFLRLFVNMSQGGVTYKCSGCDWTFTFGTQAPTGTTNAVITAGTSTAIPVASGGASFTNGMVLLLDTGSNAEVVTVVGTPTATSIPVPLASFTKNHSSAATFGQLLLTPAYNNSGEQSVPQNSY